MLSRLILTVINIFFPPLSILLLCGPSTDCLINSLLFVCGVIPSHAHGFYITCTYFHRKRKVRKGRWPGPIRPGIYSARVQNGGASIAEVARLEERMEAEREKAVGGWKVGMKRSRKGGMMY